VTVPPVKSLSPPVGGWCGCNPTLVIQIAQMLMAARRHIGTDSPLGRRLTAAWRGIDPDHPDATAYARLVAALQPAEIDYQATFNSLLSERADD
jgi:hypothetical protein